MAAGTGRQTRPWRQTFSSTNMQPSDESGKANGSIQSQDVSNYFQRPSAPSESSDSEAIESDEDGAVDDEADESSDLGDPIGPVDSEDNHLQNQSPSESSESDHESSAASASSISLKIDIPTVQQPSLPPPPLSVTFAEPSKPSISFGPLSTDGPVLPPGGLPRRRSTMRGQLPLLSSLSRQNSLAAQKAAAQAATRARSPSNAKTWWPTPKELGRLFRRFECDWLSAHIMMSLDAISFCCCCSLRFQMGHQS